MQQVMYYATYVVIAALVLYLVVYVLAVWPVLADWSSDVLEACYETQQTLFRGERFPFWLGIQGLFARYILSIDCFCWEQKRRLRSAYIYYKYHQKAQVVMFGGLIAPLGYHSYQLWFRRWWRVPRFVFEFYCWQKHTRAVRAARKLRQQYPEAPHF